MQVETSAWPQRRPPVNRPVISFIAEAFGRPSEVAVFACSAIVERAAEKFVALTRRAGAARDPGALRSGRSGGTRSRSHAIGRGETRGHEFPAYGADPLAETLRAVADIAASAECARDYAVLLRDMVYGAKEGFEAAMTSVFALADRLKENG
jgi:hypothetical protein